MKNSLDYSERIFIAGGNGMVGSAIIRNIWKNKNKEQFKKTLILSPNRDELDLTDFASVKLV